MLVNAHEQVYGKGKATRKSRREMASALAADPEVHAAIAEFEQQLMPLGDLRVCRQRMLANLQHLALSSPDQKVRLAASINLLNYIDEREQRERARDTASAVTVDTLLAELSALRPVRPTLELEEVRDTGEPEPAAPTEREEVSDAPADPE
jgi:hypothetical protein